jgi:VNT family MFS transporter (synaptic vesicle glycoprotein 2)
MLVSGLGLVADTAELLVIPFILPSAEVELCMNASQKTWLSKYCLPIQCEVNHKLFFLI